MSIRIDPRLVAFGVCIALAVAVAIFGLQRDDETGLFMAGAVVLSLIGIMTGAGVFTE